METCYTLDDDAQANQWGPNMFFYLQDHNQLTYDHRFVQS